LVPTTDFLCDAASADDHTLRLGTSPTVQICLEENTQPATRNSRQVDRCGSEDPQRCGGGNHRLPRSHAAPIREMARMKICGDRDLATDCGSAA
jgi:hypothetical protein